MQIRPLLAMVKCYNFPEDPGNIRSQRRPFFLFGHTVAFDFAKEIYRTIDILVPAVSARAYQFERSASLRSSWLNALPS